MKIGTKIRLRRKDKNLTLEYVAGKIGVSKQTVQRYETGEINIPYDKLIALADVLECNLYFDNDDAITNKFNRLSPSQQIAVLRLIDSMLENP